MKYELRELEYFVCVAREGGFTRAAEVLHITQPALSRKIRELEERMGVLLLSRSTRHVELTEAGQVVYEHCCKLLNESDELEKSLETLRRGARGRVRIAYRSYAQSNCIMRLTACLHDLYPNIELVTVRNYPLESLESEKADAALIVFGQAQGMEQIETMVLKEEGLSAFIPISRKLADSSKEIRMEEIRNEKFILPVRNDKGIEQGERSLYGQIRRFLLHEGVAEENIDFAQDVQEFRVRVIIEQKIGIMPDSSRIIENEMLRCRPICGCRQGFGMTLAWRREDRGRREIAALLDAARMLQNDL